MALRPFFVETNNFYSLRHPIVGLRKKAGYGSLPAAAAGTRPSRRWIPCGIFELPDRRSNGI
jgi:hypothetical protein